MNIKVFIVKDVADYLPFFAVVKAIKQGTIQLQATPPLVPTEWQDSLAQVGDALLLAERIKAQPIDSPLHLTYWSATPYRLGDGAMKISAVPLSVKPPFDLAGASELANGLREAVPSRLAAGEIVFDVGVQLRTDPETMPIENACHEWPESLSPYPKVATLRLPSRANHTA